jgi:outer membrane cobalamin receptor
MNQTASYKHTSYYFLVLLFILIAGSSFSQKITVNGYVKDSTSGELLPYSNVWFVQLATGVAANQYGYFSGIVKKGNLEIIVSFTGYKSEIIKLNLQCDTTLNIYLKAPLLGEVTILGNRVSNFGNDLNRTSIPMARIKEMPPFLGEYDLIKALAFTPGVNSGTDGSSSLFVRGGSADQNLVLLDGATIYSNSHLFGFISVFNPEAISHAELFKGNFPARYGGRLSSVLNITMKEGNTHKNETTMTVGPISSQITNQGPLIKGKASYLLSGRATYTSLITMPLYFIIGKHDAMFNYLMYDLNAKVNYSFNEREKLFLSVYSGNDFWNITDKYNSKKTSVGLNWGNTIASLRYTRQFSNRVFSVSQLTYNHFNFNYKISDESLAKPAEYETSSASTGSKVYDFTAKQRFEISTGISNSMVFGFDLVNQVFYPDFYKLKNINLGTNLPDSRNNRYEFFSASAYIEDKYQLTGWLGLNGGLRYSSQFLKDITYHSLEPRIEAVAKTADDISFSLALSHMSQPVFQLTNTGQGLPIDVWAPVTKNLRPSKADQWSAGIKRDLKALPLSVQAEVYYKRMSGLIDYNQGVSFVTNVSKSWEQNIVQNGIGKSYGFELMVSKTTGRLNAWFGYTLARNYRKFGQINDGQWYLARFDRTHDFETTMAYKINKKWKCSMNFVYNTGQPATLATTVHEDLSGHRIPVYTSRNNLRMPDYHRMDVSFSKEFLTRRKKHPATISFGAFNVYSRVNPFYITLDNFKSFGGKDNSGQDIGYVSRYKSGTLFGIVPFVNYSVKF